MSARTWTLEQRQRQSEAIKRWKPWEQSTGPKSPEGKAAVSGNAWSVSKDLREVVTQARAEIRALRAVLRKHREWLK